MRFEEQFPSLKNESDPAEVWFDNVLVVPIDAIQKHCLDKARVKEAILKMWIPSEVSAVMARVVKISLLEELGLEID